jgi:hypothetical protein
MKSAKITGETKLSTHLPLHIFVGTVPQNIWLLKTTDKMFSRFPWIRKLGGVIIFEGKKL